MLASMPVHAAGQRVAVTAAAVGVCFSALFFAGGFADAPLVWIGGLALMGAAALAASTAWLFRPLYLVPLVVPASAYWSLPVIAVVVGLLSSLIALRRAITVDPALAFGAGG